MSDELEVEEIENHGSSGLVSVPKFQKPDFTKFSAEQLAQMDQYLANEDAKLKTLVNQLSMNEGVGFIREFATLDQGINATARASMLPENLKLNRYTNIVAYDHSRVTIAPNKHNFNSEYINANYIDGYKKKNLYIATQGPLPETFNAFWQMVWEQNADVIVMVTNEIEGGKIKCHRYWPEESEKTATYGTIQVTFNYQEVKPTYLLRWFTITHTPTGEQRDLAHFGYVGWPDHGVPATTKELLSFRKEIYAKLAPNKGPIVVHCSAGVGRTGTLIAVDRFLCCLYDQGKDTNVYDIVRDLRRSRNFMVQSQLQYTYVYTICIDAIRQVAKEVKKAIKRSKQSEQEKNQDEIAELEADIAAADQELKTRIEEEKTSADARHDEGKPTDDLHLAQKVPTVVRKQSLVAVSENEAWKVRGNVPLGVDEKGYRTENAPAIPDRLVALSMSSEPDYWKSKDIFLPWKQEVYETATSLTPLESRLQSLANSEHAWRERGDQTRSAHEETARLNLLALSVRLEALSDVVEKNERYWREKSLEQASKPIPKMSPKKESDDKLGALSSRLQALKDESTKFEKSKEDIQKSRVALVKNDISKRATEADKEMQARMAKEQKEREERARQREEEQRAKERDERERREREEKAEAERREKAKMNIKRVSESKLQYDPASARNEKDAAKQKEQEEKANKEAAEKAKKEAEAMRKAEEEKKKAEAQAKAQKFIGKMK